MKTTKLATLWSVIFATTLLLASPLVHAADVEMHTSKGVLVISVDEERAPITAANFLQYVEDGFYDGLIFHRIIPGFVVQGGGFKADMARISTRAPIINEADNGVKNTQYSLSMARTQAPNSATSQFFINLNDNPPLDYTGPGTGYAVFGEVTKGQEIVDAMAKVATGNVQQFQDVPKEPIIIEKAIIVTKE
ncbi:MAG: peptidylprolyl isomerase [Gammaproteobacteria bacterium WSBS_2016_MAG_OTU1]